MKNPINSFSDDFDFLSNFYMTPIVFEGKTYISSEHAFQAAKSLDDSQREAIRKTKTPYAAKKLGNNSKKTTLRKDWDNVKVGIMLIVLKDKFKPGTDLAKKLVDTGDVDLIEGNTWGDTFWGVCKDKGQNHLGKLLMQIRKDLVEEL